MDPVTGKDLQVLFSEQQVTPSQPQSLRGAEITLTATTTNTASLKTRQQQTQRPTSRRQRKRQRRLEEEQQIFQQDQENERQWWKQQLLTLQNEIIPQQEAKLQRLEEEVDKLLQIEYLDERLQGIKEERRVLDEEEARVSEELWDALKQWNRTRFV
ncbi:hypothetical protein BGW39_011596 [Mortierella sp. 14UC]|nr:hypothetical protein BGW39_011596 [Mortierella sp. 14UC]